MPKMNCFEQNDPRAIVKKVKVEDCLLKTYHKVLKRPKTPPLKQSDVFEGVFESKSKKGKSRRRSSRRKGAKAPDLY